MTYTLVVSEEVEAEVRNIYDWYEDKKKGLGLAFIKSLETSFQRIEEHPNAFHKRYRNLCADKMNRFPYLVIFKTEMLTITIVKVVHERRHPKIWKRLK